MVVRRSGVQELLLFRQAVNLADDAPQEIDVIARVVGHVVDVRCSVCGCSRTWVPGGVQLEALLQRVRRMDD
jgi:hypothetical protein